MRCDYISGAFNLLLLLFLVALVLAVFIFVNMYIVHEYFNAQCRLMGCPRSRNFFFSGDGVFVVRQIAQTKFKNLFLTISSWPPSRWHEYETITNFTRKSIVLNDILFTDKHFFFCSNFRSFSNRWCHGGLWLLEIHRHIDESVVPANVEHHAKTSTLLWRHN